MSGLIPILQFMVIIPLVVGLIYFRSLPSTGKIFFVILLSYLVVEVIATLMIYRANNNMIVYHVYVPVLTAMYGYFYYHCVRSPWAQRWIVTITAAAIAIEVGEMIYKENTLFNSVSLGVMSFTIFAFSLYLFYEMALNQVDHRSYWVNIFTFLYFFVSVGYFIAARYLQRNDMEAMILMGNMHAIVNTVCYIGYGYGLKTYAR